MRGAPWQGLFYGFVLEVVIGIGALAYALQTEDALAKTIAWGLVALTVVAAVRTIRRAAGQGEDRTPPTGRWWFGG
jgi:hypothetical protein